MVRPRSSTTAFGSPRGAAMQTNLLYSLGIGTRHRRTADAKRPFTLRSIELINSQSSPRMPAKRFEHKISLSLRQSCYEDYTSFGAETGIKSIAAAHSECRSRVLCVTAETDHRGPEWVIRDRMRPSISSPLWPQLRTYRCSALSDASGQTRTLDGRLTLPITKVRQGGSKQVDLPSCLPRLRLRGCQ